MGIETFDVADWIPEILIDQEMAEPAMFVALRPEATAGLVAAIVRPN